MALRRPSRGVKTPIKPAKEHGTKEKRDQTKHKTDKKPDATSGSNTQDRSHLSRRPEHEQPAKFPEGLKRPDLEAVVDGKKIASEFQRQLFDDIKRGNCSRCHKGGYNRKNCKDPKAKWEEKLDKERLAYWASVLKWQQRAAQQKGTGANTPATTKPLPFTSSLSPNLNNTSLPSHTTTTTTTTMSHCSTFAPQ